MNLFIICFLCGASFLLSFLLFFHPLQQNVVANKWLSLFVFTIGSAFIGSYFIVSGAANLNSHLFKIVISLQFLLPTSFYISILYFVTPTKSFNNQDWLHFLPFIIYAVAEMILNFGKESISTLPFLNINDNISLVIRDLLPFLALFYLIKSYIILIKHKNNLKRISSSIDQISLDWLIQFLFILSISVIIWFNDALFGLPYLSQATNFVYAGAIFFLAFFSIKQKAIFQFKAKDIKEVSEVLTYESYKPIENQLLSEIEPIRDLDLSNSRIVSNEALKEKPKLKRLNEEQIENLSGKLSLLMEKEKIFLENELDLPTVAEKLGISIHETSFLINEVTKENFYNFINKYRVDEAKKLLASLEMEKLNILGIAFASGFNSKTTFNTTFKKIVGISPSQYSKEAKN